MKIAVQLDFDGTVTVEDVSFLLLDTFVGSGWHKYWDEYTSGNITVGAFNKKAFGMMRADRKTMTDFVLNSPLVKIRPGFKEFVEYCKKKGIKIFVVSNGLTFYIKALLKKFGINGLKIHAAENIFHDGGVRVQYLGPDGKEVNVGFKETYTDYLCKKDYHVIYVGNGTSDIFPSRKAQYICATADLLRICQKEKLKCYPFNDFYDVVKIMESLKLG
jgi:2-hydroxy-3-keto-5-methylthiopentenyl-1-phosphate phosphatase